MWVLVATAWAGGTVNVDAISVDGLELRELSCTFGQQLLLGPIVVAGALAQQKAALDACAPDGGAFRATVVWAADAKATVTQSSAPPAATCVQQALAKTRGPTAGTCTFAVLTGPKPAAEAAFSRLPAAR